MHRSHMMELALREDRSVSLEDMGQTKLEVEFEIYGTMRNMDDLTKAAGWELQEQWGLYVPKSDKNAGSGGPRVRMTQVKDGIPEYILTTKVKAQRGNQECEETSTQDMFNLFRILADQGLRKKRYFFPVPGHEDMTFEVDVFFGPNGAELPHVKIDLEISPKAVEEGLTAADIKLPFEMSDIRIISPGQKNEEDLAFVRTLFDKYYNMPNILKDENASMEDLTRGFEQIFGSFKLSSDMTDEEKAERTALIEKKKGESAERMAEAREELASLVGRCVAIGALLEYGAHGYESNVKRALHELARSVNNAYSNPADIDAC